MKFLIEISKKSESPQSPEVGRKKKNADYVSFNCSMEYYLRFS